MLKVFEKYSEENEILDWLGKFDFYFSKNQYTISNDGVIDVDGIVDISKKELVSIPYHFGEVTGHFLCYKNNLVNLIGCPSSVGGIFDCSHNKLTSLQGGPSSVGGDFYCSANKMTKIGNLVGLPKFIRGSFTCSVSEANIFGYKLVGDVIIPNYGEFESMDILYEENGSKYFQPNAFRAFVRQEAPSYLSKINIKEIEDKFIKNLYIVV